MGVLNKIFSRREKLVDFDFSFIGTDMHSHLIPGIDDGSKSLEESLFLIKGLVDLGYKNIVTTPHTMSDFYKNTPEIIKQGLKKVKKAVKEQRINVDIQVASEYYADFDFLQKIEKEELLTFGDNYVLIEFSFVTPPKKIKDVIFALQTNGYKPVLAHPERYLYWFKNPKAYEIFTDRNVKLQLNILSLAGWYSEDAKYMAEFFVKNNLASFLGTDLHNANHLQCLQNMKIKEGLFDQIKNINWLNKQINNNY